MFCCQCFLFIQLSIDSIIEIICRNVPTNVIADQVNDIEHQQSIANQSVHDASDESRKVEENIDSIRVWLKGDGALSKVEEPFSLDSL